MRFVRGVATAVLLPASLLLGTPAARADIGPDQAKALTAQLRDWLRGMAGPSATLPDLRAAAEGDHYLLTVPFAELAGPDKDLTAKLRPLDAGRWAADAIHFPADATLAAKLPRRPGQDAPENIDLHLTIAGQDSHAEIDPTMASHPPSSPSCAASRWTPRSRRNAGPSGSTPTIRR